MSDLKQCLMVTYFIALLPAAEQIGTFVVIRTALRELIAIASDNRGFNTKPKLGRRKVYLTIMHLYAEIIYA